MAGLVAVPIVVTLLSITGSPTPVWSHLKATVLSEYVANSLILMGLTATFSLILGVSTGWLIGACSFKGQRTLSWLLMLPLSAPAYIVAYVYTDLLEVSGPVQSALRSWLSLGIGELQLPSIRTLPGAAVLLSLVLYPYIYLLARNSFAGRSGTQFDAARLLGHGPYSAFFRIALPAARPAIIGGLALVLMETLADFGVVSYFSVPTFSTGIYRTWIGLGDSGAALKLASLMLLFVIALIGMEETSRRSAVDRSDLSRATPISLTGGRALLALTVCSVPVLLGFLVPVCRLAIYAIEHWHLSSNRHFGALVFNSTSLAIATGVMATMIAWGLAYLKRLNPSHPQLRSDPPIHLGIRAARYLAGARHPGRVRYISSVVASGGSLGTFGWDSTAALRVCVSLSYSCLSVGGCGIFWHFTRYRCRRQNIGCRTESDTVAHSFTTAATQYSRCQPACVCRCHARAPRDTHIAALQFRYTRHARVSISQR